MDFSGVFHGGLLRERRCLLHLGGHAHLYELVLPDFQPRHGELVPGRDCGDGGHGDGLPDLDDVLGRDAGEGVDPGLLHLGVLDLADGVGCEGAVRERADAG